MIPIENVWCWFTSYDVWTIFPAARRDVGISFSTTLGGSGEIAPVADLIRPSIFEPDLAAEKPKTYFWSIFAALVA